MAKDCWVCNGTEPEMLGKCDLHNVCDVCRTKRADLTTPPWGTRTGFRYHDCEEKRREKAVSDFSKEDHEDHEFSYNDKVKCPHCGYVYRSDDLHESEENIACPNCSNEMDVEVDVCVYYSTSKSPTNPKEAI